MNGIVLQTENIRKTYGAFTAVKGLTLDVHEGEVFGFLGPNGAGKTTSIQMMCGLLKPDSGRVLIHGKAVHGREDHARAQVGLCPQNIVVWERLTCQEQLEFTGQMYDLSAAQARAAATRLLKELELEDKARQQARTLSGGMQRRLNIALALVHDPQIVVFDEPEAGLDPQSRVRVRQFIQSLARRKTVILTTHNMDEADRVADRVAIIDHGELLVLDTPEHLKARLGEGDVVEWRIDPAEGAAAVAALAPVCPQAVYDAENQALRARMLEGVAHLAQMSELLARAQVRAGEVSLRANTLEDVFIHLTGRRLRE